MANVVLEMTGDNKKMLRLLGEAQAKVKELEVALANAGKVGEEGGEKIAGGSDKAEKALKKAGKASEESFGDHASSQLAKYALSIGGITAAVAVVEKAFTEMGRSAEDAGRRILESFESRLKLIQLAKNPAEYAKLMDEVTNLRTHYGMSTNKAADLLLAAAPAGLDKDIGRIAPLEHIGFDPLAAVAGLKATRATMPAAGTPAQIINQWLAASNSPEDREKMARSVVNAARPWSLIGGTNEDLLATMGSMEEAAGGPDVAAGELRTMAGRVYLQKKLGLLKFKDWHIPYGPHASQVAGIPNPVLAGANLMRRALGYKDLDVATLGGSELLEALPGLGLAGALRGKGGESESVGEWMGRPAGNITLELFGRNRKDIAARRSQILAAKAGTGGKADLFDNLLGIFESQPLLTNEESAAIAEQRTQIDSEQRFAGFDALYRRADSLRKRQQNRMGTGTRIWDAAARTIDDYTFGLFQGPETKAEAAAYWAKTTATSPAETREAEQILFELRKLREAAERTERKTAGSTTLRKPNEDK